MHAASLLAQRGVMGEGGQRCRTCRHAMCREREHRDNQALFHASPPRKNAPHPVPLSRLASLTVSFRIQNDRVRRMRRRAGIHAPLPRNRISILLPGLFVVALSVGSGPRSAASIRLCVAARCSRLSDSMFGLCITTRKPGAAKRIRPRAGRKRERPHISMNFGSRLRAHSQKSRRFTR
jgi:hypothetical protein